MRNPTDTGIGIAMVRAIVALALAGGTVTLPATAQNVSVVGLGYDKGSPSAPVTIIEFGDFACSACAQFARETMGALQREFISTGIVRWKYVPFTSGSFPNTDAANRAAECAAEQDAFWSMHDLLYEHQREWSRLRDPRPKLAELANLAGLDAGRFAQCYEQHPRRDRIEANNAAARDLLIRATPTFFVNAQRAVGALPIAEWRKIIALVRGS